jgi:hypothetical protein
MAAPKKGPAHQTPGQILRPDDEVVWVSCRGGKKCEGKQAKVLLKKNEGMGGTWIQYQCVTCKRTFAIRF